MIKRSLKSEMKFWANKTKNKCRIRRNSIFALLLITVIINSFFVSDVNAADENDEDLKTVRVGYLLYEGFQEGAGNEPKSGYGYEYLQQVAYYAGWKYEYVNGSFSELLRMLKNGEIDIMGDVSYTDERAQYINYAAEEQGREYYYLFVREDRTDISADDISTLNGARVGINKGSIQVELFKKFCEEKQINCEIVLYESSEERYEDMNNGRLDATVSTNVVAKKIVNFHWNSIVKIGSSSYYFATNKKRPDLLNDLNKAINMIHQADWYYNEKVYMKYYGKTSASFSGLSMADLELVKKRQTITIGYMENMLPYADKDEKSGELIGLLPAFMSCMKNNYGVEFEIKNFNSYESMCSALYNGEIDTMFPVYGSYWIAEENNMMITDAITTSNVLLVYSGSYSDEITDMIAVTDENPLQQSYVKEHYPESEVIKCDSIKDCIRAVMSGKATCTLLSSDVYYANHNDLDDLGDFSVSKTENKTSVGFATRKNDREMYFFMRKCVDSMTEQEINEALMASRHVKSEQSVRQFFKNHFEIMFLIEGSFILLILAFYVYYIISKHRAEHLAKSNSELNEKVYIDLATGLPNKNKCEEIIFSASEVSKPTACFMLDLNDLKTVNDTLGHEMGDLMILNFATLLRQAVPLNYFVGRFGGDEFIVIAENISNRDEAEHLLSKIRDIALKFNGTNGDFRLSYACGYAFSEDFPSFSMSELLDIADCRMYENKKEIKMQK